MREGTYWPRLCLIQLADPKGNAFAGDPLISDINLVPLFDLMSNEKVPKVIHAARQDIEIFFYFLKLENFISYNIYYLSSYFYYKIIL